MQSPRPRSLGLLRGEVVKQAENNGTAMPTLPRLSVNSQSPNNCQGFILHRSLLPLHRFSLRRGVSLSVCLCRNAENATWATVDHCPSEQRCRLLWTDRWFNFRISLLPLSSFSFECNSRKADQTAKNFVLYALDIAKHWWALMHMICRCHILGLQVTTTCKDFDVSKLG